MVLKYLSCLNKAAKLEIYCFFPNIFKVAVVFLEDPGIPKLTDRMAIFGIQLGVLECGHLIEIFYGII